MALDERILRALRGELRGLTAKQLSDELMVDLLTVYSRLRALRADGCVEKAGKGPSRLTRKSVTYFRLPQAAVAAR